MTSLLKSVFGGGGMKRNPSFDDLSMGASHDGVSRHGTMGAATVSWKTFAYIVFSGESEMIVRSRWCFASKDLAFLVSS